MFRDDGHDLFVCVFAAVCVCYVILLFVIVFITMFMLLMQ